MACRWCNPFFLPHDSCTLLLVHTLQNAASAPAASPPWERCWAFPLNIWALSYYTTAVETNAVSKLSSPNKNQSFAKKANIIVPARSNARSWWKNLEDWMIEKCISKKEKRKGGRERSSEKEKMRWKQNNSEEEGPNRGGALLARSVTRSSEKDKHEQSSQGRRRTREDFRTYSRASISRVDMTRCCHSRRCAHPQCTSVFRRPLLLLLLVLPPPPPPFSSRRLKDLILASGAKHDAKKRSTWARGRRSRRKKEREKKGTENTPAQTKNQERAATPYSSSFVDRRRPSAHCSPFCRRLLLLLLLPVRRRICASRRILSNVVVEIDLLSCIAKYAERNDGGGGASSPCGSYLGIIIRKLEAAWRGREPGPRIIRKGRGGRRQTKLALWFSCGLAGRRRHSRHHDDHGLSGSRQNYRKSFLIVLLFLLFLLFCIWSLRCALDAVRCGGDDLLWIDESVVLLGG